MLSHKYLKCVKCGAEIEDDGIVNGHGCDALLRAEYADKRFTPREGGGLFKFRNWLPIGRVLKGSSAPVTYKSEKLARILGLENLFITFSGYWEEKSVLMSTCTFKECEAYAVLARFPAKPGNVLVVASAGNTARAFIKVASENGIPLIAVIPKQNLDNLWLDAKSECVKIIAAGEGCDYSDAISLAGALCEAGGFISEGGARNVARRDGMGTVMLSAALCIGDAPDYYFQAVGSGTGAIAAWEANARLVESGYAKKMASLQLSQNAPFLPIYGAWKSGSREIPGQDGREAKEQIGQILAGVLSNRNPPYAVRGGLYDALSATSGDMWAVANDEIVSARQLFYATEGCDIYPEAGAALASLIHAKEAGRVGRRDVILLNITGGGYDNVAAMGKTRRLDADIIVPGTDIANRNKIEAIANTLKLH